MFGFSDGLVAGSNGRLLLDTEVNEEINNGTDSDTEGTENFKAQAMSRSPGYTIPRTRSKTKADLAQKRHAPSSSPAPVQRLRLRHDNSVHEIVDSINQGPRFSPGDLVYAYKGKNVPFWFPGLVREQSKKGYFKIDFLADFGQEICPISNIMQFKDFDERKKQEKTSKLFNIPKRFALNYENALVVARSHKSDD